MSHARTTIRNAFVAAVTGLTTTGSNVTTKKKTWSDDELPSLTVRTSSESVDEEKGKVARIQHRDLDIVIEGRCKNTGDVDALLDTISSEVETAIFGASFSGIFALDLIETIKDEELDLEQPTGLVTITFRIQYLTEEGSPNTALP